MQSIRMWWRPPHTFTTGRRRIKPENTPSFCWILFALRLATKSTMMAATATVAEAVMITLELECVSEPSAFGWERNSLGCFTLSSLITHQWETSYVSVEVLLPLFVIQMYSLNEYTYLFAFLLLFQRQDVSWWILFRIFFNSIPW